MSLYVVDASIAVKLYVPEVHSAHSIRFFSDGHELIAPEFMLAEFLLELMVPRRRQSCQGDARSVEF